MQIPRQRGPKKHQDAIYAGQVVWKTGACISQRMKNECKCLKCLDEVSHSVIESLRPS